MGYSSFLFSQLLRNISPSYSQLPIDIMYVAHEDLHTKFLHSIYNTSTKSEYNCIFEFLESIPSIDLVFSE